MNLIEQINNFTSLLLEASFMPPDKDTNEGKLNLHYIEDLYSRLFFFPIQSIKDGLIAEDWTDEVLRNRLKTASLLLKDWITPDGIAQFETDSILSNKSESMKFVCSKMGIADGKKYMLKVFTLFRCANLDIEMVADMLDEVESLLNPQPDAINEQEHTVKNISILEDEEVKAVMQNVESKGLMEYKEGWYYWNGDNVLLSYLCCQISQYKDYSKQRRGQDYLPNWTKFKNIFKAKGKKKGEWVIVTSSKLAEYKKGYLRLHKDFSPEGSKVIDEILMDNIKI